MKIAKQIIECFKNGGKIMICGNGGSAAMTQEMAAEFVCKFEHDRKPLPALALTTDSSILTAIGNDMGFNYIFTRQIEALGKPKDILLIFTTSQLDENIKHSLNLLLAKHTAKRLGIKCFYALRRGSTTAKRQEYQHKWMHQVVREVEKAFII